MPNFSLNDWNFWLQFFKYAVVVWIAYFMPGDMLLKKALMPKIFRIPLAIVIGMTLFGFIGVISAYLGIRYFSSIYVIICAGIWIIHRLKNRVARVPFSVDKFSFVLIFIGAIAQLTTIWFTGVTVNKTATYCCGDPNDNFFYGTISREITHAIPPQYPGLTGMEFKNYHYWSNIIVGETARVFHIPVYQLQFQYSTVLIAFVVGLLLLGLCWELGLSKNFSRWLLFFFYFGGDAIYWYVAIAHSGSIFAMSSLEDGIGFLANYPRAIAVMTSIAALTLLFKLKKDFSIQLLVTTSLLFASLAITKIYIGFFWYVGLVCLALYDVVKKKSFVTMSVGLLTLLFCLPIYLSANASAGGLYYVGFWRAQNFIVQPALNLVRLDMARLIYENDHKWIQVMVFNIGFTVLYFTLIFGTKLFALLNTKKSLRTVPFEFHCLFIIPLVASAVIGFFFNQDVGESNTFNFIVSSLIYISFYTALYCASITESKKKWLVYCFTCVIILLTAPRACYKVYRNINEIIHHQGFTISSDVLDTSQFIRKTTSYDDVFLIDNRAFEMDKSGPVFSMLVDRPMFLSGESLFSWQKNLSKEIDRRKLVRGMIFSNGGILQVAATLKSNKIDYLVTDNEHVFGSTKSASFYEHFYENPEVLVIKVHRELIPKDIDTQAIEAATASAYRYNELTAPYLQFFGAK